MTQKRDSFASRLGFILVSAGCAIGIGNVWKFPYITGQNGGGIFVLFYLLFLVIMAVPVLTMELAVGRASRKSAVQGYRALEKPGTKWHIHGWFCLIGCYLLMMYYTTVSGWMMDYFWKFLSGQFEEVSMGSVDGIFSSMLGNPAEMMFFMLLTVVLGFLVCSGSVQKGLERVTKVMMIGLLCLIVVLAVHSLTLSGASEGLAFYLLPSVSRAKEAGLGNIISAAMNQSFFTLSLGIAAMEIFGSYMSREHTLGSESLKIAGLDTFVALMAGLIIFPACFSYDVEPGQGPSLIFVTLPKVFINMAGGRIWGSLFFLFMTFASFSTVTAVFENLIAGMMDNFGWSRRKSVVFNLILVALASVPCVLGYNVWSGFHPIPGKDVLDSEDFLVSNILLPGGSLVFLLFCVTKWGWGFDSYLKEANTGAGIRISPKLKYYFRFVLPVLILIILIQGLL
ncbi:MAG: sodium-dependent transporter [Lachnospiraceae bacterium]|jgi:NSS family neurotransmitter:Na+ symporter